MNGGFSRPPLRLPPYRSQASFVVCDIFGVGCFAGIDGLIEDMMIYVHLRRRWRRFLFYWLGSLDRFRSQLRLQRHAALHFVLFDLKHNRAVIASVLAADGCC